MEKSHWKAKCLYMSKTNKGGGLSKISASFQLMLISFRTMYHRMQASQRSTALREKINDAASGTLDDASSYFQEIVDLQVDRAQREEEQDEVALAGALEVDLVEGEDGAIQFASDEL